MTDLCYVLMQVFLSVTSIQGVPTNLGINWYNDGLRQQRLTYQLICELYDRYRSDNLLELRKQSRAHYRRSISSAKIGATSRFIQNSNNRPRAVWTVIKSIRGTAVRAPPSLDCDELNSHFVQLPGRIVAALPVSAESPLTICDLTVRDDVAFAFSGISEQEVRELLRGLKSSNTRDVFWSIEQFY